MADDGGKVSDRELEALMWVARGYTTREAAEAMLISRHTVKAHLQAVNRALSAHCRVHALARALEAGIIEVTDISGSTAGE